MDVRRERMSRWASQTPEMRAVLSDPGNASSEPPIAASSTALIHLGTAVAVVGGLAWVGQLIVFLANVEPLSASSRPRVDGTRTSCPSPGRGGYMPAVLNPASTSPKRKQGRTLTVPRLRFGLVWPRFGLGGRPPALGASVADESSPLDD